MPQNERRRIHFDKDIVGIDTRRVSFSFYGIDVYKCRPVVAHPIDDNNPKEAFDLYLISTSWGGRKLPNGRREKKKLEMVICFKWISPGKYKKVKNYIIGGITTFEGHYISGYVISRFLIKKLKYEVENWM